MSDFYVGQKVVCVDDTNSNRGAAIPLWPLKNNVVYTVASLVLPCAVHKNTIWQHDIGPSIHLVEVIRSGCMCCGEKIPFRATRFRPLETKAIGAFRKIAQDITDGKYVEIKEDA